MLPLFSGSTFAALKSDQRTHIGQLTGSLWRLLEVAVPVLEPCGDRRVFGDPLSQGHGRGEFAVDLTGALAQSSTERNQSLRQDEDTAVRRGRRALAVDEPLLRNILGQVRQDWWRGKWGQELGYGEFGVRGVSGQWGTVVVVGGGYF